MAINPHIFREYDIRGLAEEELTDEVAFAVGRAFGTFVGGSGRVTVGRDVRLSSFRLNSSFSRGLVASGCDVVELGAVPTPLVYFSLFNLGSRASAVVTGSHNPVQYNGFKLALGDLSLYGPEIQDVRKIIESSRYSSGKGSSSSSVIVSAYIEEISRKINVGRKLRVAMDAGNGTAGPVALELFEKLGVEVVPLFCEPDGRFPNHLPDPTIPENVEDLRKLVLAQGLDLGIAYDGDGDRIGAIDSEGRIIWGDQLVAIFAGEILKKTPGGTIIFDVKCSQGLEEHIRVLGGRPLMWKTGHSLIKRKLKETKGLLAGEMSGHMFFADDYYGYDDAIFASARLVALVSNSEKSLSRLVDELPQYVSTPEMRLECPDELKFQLVDAVREFFKKSHSVIEIDGARILFGDGWGLVRASNTQPALVARFEAKSEKRLEEIKSEVLAEVAHLKSEMARTRSGD
ncbi:MAG: phosphomannomutase/phosphoglucomutase [Candidatus Eisenbacteria bacterium]|nr:phosphomannomutase/phosphoglucomutase [Candidatus Eisenbacteria bacterium]